MKILYILIGFMIFHVFALGAPPRSCPSPRLINGKTFMRPRSKFMRFTCDSGFAMIGNRYSQCISGEWDSPVPICTKNGCSPVKKRNGQVSSTDDWASAYLNCQPGFEVAGSKWSFCNGTDWDRTLGSCRETQIGPATWCDFEHEGICEWTSVDLHEYKWMRFNNMERLYGLEHSKGAANSRSGPRHDHTTLAKDGNFMIAQSTAFTKGQTARLLSPLYQAAHSINSCFQFYYFMYGRQSGGLRVLLKPQSVGLDEVIANASYTLWELSGDQGSSWNQNRINLEQQPEEFQIAIEAMSGYTAFTDIAIDDVSLLNGVECGLIESSTPAEEAGGVFDQESCANRCNEPRPKLPGFKEEWISNKTGRGGVMVHCDCFEGCEDVSSCCNDYLSVCDSDESTESATIVSLVVTEVKETQRPTMSTTISTTLPTTLATTTATTPRKETTQSKAIPTKATMATSTSIRTTMKSTNATTEMSTTSRTSTTTMPTLPPTTQPTIPLQTTSVGFTTASTSSTSSPTAGIFQRSYYPAIAKEGHSTPSPERSVLTFKTSNQSPTSAWVPTLSLIGLAAFFTFLATAVLFRVYIYRGFSKAAGDEVRYLIDNEDVLL